MGTSPVATPASTTEEIPLPIGWPPASPPFPGTVEFTNWMKAWTTQSLKVELKRQRAWQGCSSLRKEQLFRKLLSIQFKGAEAEEESESEEDLPEEDTMNKEDLKTLLLRELLNRWYLLKLRSEDIHPLMQGQLNEENVRSALAEFLLHHNCIYLIEALWKVY